MGAIMRKGSRQALTQTRKPMSTTQKIPTTKVRSGEYTGTYKGLDFKVRKSFMVPTRHGGSRPTIHTREGSSKPNWKLHIPEIDIHLNGLAGKRAGVNKAVELINDHIPDEPDLPFGEDSDVTYTVVYEERDEHNEATVEEKLCKDTSWETAYRTVADHEAPYLLVVYAHDTGEIADEVYIVSGDELTYDPESIFKVSA